MSEPDDAPLSFPEDTKAALQGVWQIAPATDAEPDVVYAGDVPSALFRSTDRGRTSLATAKCIAAQTKATIGSS